MPSDVVTGEQWRIQDLPGGGQSVSASLNEDLGVEPLAKSRGRSGPNPPESESFLYILIQKKWLKVKDLSENLPPCRIGAATTSPKFLSMGGRPPGPPITGSATADEALTEMLYALQIVHWQTFFMTPHIS